MVEIVERLSNIDASFLEVETSGPSVAVGAAMRVEGKSPTLEELREFMAGRIGGMRRFRQKVVPSRTRVRAWKWVDSEPDLSYHIREVKMMPGQKIDESVSEIMEVPMDRDRPLWDTVLLHGYSETEYCMVTRLHHSIADGQGAVILLGQLIDLAPQVGGPTLADGISMMTKPQEAPVEDLERGTLDALATKVIRAIETSLDELGAFISTAPDTVRTIIEMTPRRPTNLVGPVSAKRKWVGGQFSLSEVKQARKAFKGVTINDMVLASVAVGFNHLLESRGENSNGRTLRAVMPVSLRTNMDSNNQIGILPAPIPLGEMEPAKRMRLIRERTQHAKRSRLPKIIDSLAKTAQTLTPQPINEYIVSRSGDASQLFAETLVTNVPGPQIPLYHNGQLIIGTIPIIPIEGSLRIVVGITSWDTDLNIGITGDGEHATDVDVLLAGIIAGFQELCDVAAVKRAKRDAAHQTAAEAAGEAPTKKTTAKKTTAKKSAPRKSRAKKSS